MEPDIDLENKQISNAYRGLLRSIQVELSNEDKRFIRKAFNTSVEAHKNARRKSGEPFIYHPIAVARICAEEIGLGKTSVACALLHDTVEDTHITLDDIHELFGVKVRKIIDGLTKISGVFDYTSSQQIENFRKMLLTLPDDVRVILIKLADRLHNMRTLDSMARDKQLKIASETSYLYAPLAHRLGLYAIKSELEDLSLKYTEPEVYEEIQRKLNKTKDVRARFIRKFSIPIKQELSDSGLKFTIKGRPKSVYSIWNKIHNKKVAFEEIYDVFAIRIIIDSELHMEKADCWRAYAIVTDHYRPNPERLRDWISHPKQNGYESLHTTVMSPTGKWVEVQIRTERMDEIAEKGLAAHWKYKKNIQAIGREPQQIGIDVWIDKIRELLENKDDNAIDFMDELKLSLYAKEIFVFTPTGELRTLPSRATALDFAFEIHSEVGAKCIGAKVNHKLVPLSYELKSGDQIEVITSEKQNPKEAWLSFVVTSKAKSKIKSVLDEERKRVVADGKEILERKLRNIKVAFDDANVQELLKLYKLTDHSDLYYQIAKGKVDFKKIKPIVIKGGRLKHGSITRTIKESFESLIDRVSGKKEELILGEGDGFDYKLSPCCNPIPGDEVFGFITIRDGIKVHRNTCPNAKQLLANYAYRIIKTRWKNQKILEFKSKIKITGIDDIGLVHKITNTISKDMNVNIKSLKFETEDGVFEGDILLLIHDTEHLSGLISELNLIEGIKRVERVEIMSE